MDETVKWLDLPKELWLMITKHLNTTIDVLRFRSVCKLWRSLLPLPSSQTLFPPQIRIPHHKFCLFQTKIYRLEPSPSSHQPHTNQDPSSSSSSSKGWIMKVGGSKSMPVPLLNPFTNSPTRQRFSSDTFPKMLNLMNFHVVELIEAYTLSHLLGEEDEDKSERADGASEPVPEVRKVVLFPSFPVEDRMVFVLYKDGKLGVSKIGDENCIIMNDGSKQYDDIILYKGQLYVVDKWGTISWIDCESLKLVECSPRLSGFSHKKQLVECGGSLYVVNMYIEGKIDNPWGMYYEVVDIKVCKLDEEWSTWLDVKNLGDVLFVLGKDSNFSLSAQDYYGCEGNCVYFYAEAAVWAFSLESSKFKSSTTFWPYPTLFHPEFNF